MKIYIKSNSTNDSFSGALHQGYVLRSDASGVVYGKGSDLDECLRDAAETLLRLNEKPAYLKNREAIIYYVDRFMTPSEGEIPFSEYGKMLYNEYEELLSQIEPY